MDAQAHEVGKRVGVTSHTVDLCCHPAGIPSNDLGPTGYGVASSGPETLNRYLMRIEFLKTAMKGSVDTRRASRHLSDRCIVLLDHLPMGANSVYHTELRVHVEIEIFSPMRLA
jgi:hypothetical protein